jgi:hypothetical protein
MRNDLHDAKAVDRGLKFAVQAGKFPWPVFK